MLKIVVDKICGGVLTSSARFPPHRKGCVERRKKMILYPTVRIEQRFYARNFVTKKFWDGKGFNSVEFRPNKKSLSEVEALFIKHTYENVELISSPREIRI